MNNIKCIFLFVITLFLFIVAFGQEGDQDVSQGSQATTLRGATVRFRPGTVTYGPRFSITREDALDLTMAGLQSAADLTPYGKGIGIALDVSDVLMATAEKSIEHANENVDSQLILLNSDSKRLEDLYKSGADLKNNAEAQSIIADLKKTPTDEQDGFYFARKAIVSPFGLYTVAKEGGTKLLTKFVGEKIAEHLNLGDKTALLWRGDEKPAGFNRSQWKRLKKQSYLVGDYLDNLEKELFELSVDRFLKSEYHDALNKFVDSIMAQHASDLNHERENDLRTDIYKNPELTLRLLPQPAVAVMAQPQPRLIAIPPRILEYAEPLVNAIAVEGQVVAAQHYQVNISNPTYSSQRTTSGYQSNSAASPSENNSPPETPPPWVLQMHEAYENFGKVKTSGSFDGNNIDTHGNSN